MAPIPDGAPSAHVDLTTFNAARVVRLLGTMNRKGHPTVGQPHRRSRLLNVPDRVEVVTADQLRAVAAEAPGDERGRGKRPCSVSVPGNLPGDAPGPEGGGEYRHRLRVEDFLIARGLAPSGTKTASDGRTVYLLPRCPFDPGHGGRGEVVVLQAPNGRMAFKCHHHSCSGKGWRHFKAEVGLPDPDHYEPPLPPRQLAYDDAEAGEEARCTDLGNARRLVKLYGDQLRFCFPWKKWLVWDGTRWRVDETGQVERLAKDAIRAIYAEAAAAGDAATRKALATWATRSEESRRIKATVDLAKSEPGVPVLPADLDRDAWLLNVPNGTLDLRTGQLREHRREDLITKLCPVAYDPDAKAPVFEDFLGKVFAGNQALVGYVRRLLGYALTGDVQEQVLAIFWGNGSNGKSTLVNLVLDVLGTDYALKAARDLFMAKKLDTHPTGLTDLFGKRLVVCIESSDTARLDEALVKELTGGDPITARRMRQDNWTFTPTHKAFLITNHKPEIAGTDEGIWRRQRLIPFTVRFWDGDDPKEVAKGPPPELKKDKAMPGKLRAEMPGVLAWCVAGCLEWQRDGLGLPDAVKAATESYRQEQDTLADFLADCCVIGDTHTAKAGELYRSFTRWCERVGEKPIKQRRFGESLEERGFTRFKASTKRYRGLRLNDFAAEDLLRAPAGLRDRVGPRSNIGEVDAPREGANPDPGPTGSHSPVNGHAAKAETELQSLIGDDFPEV